jgi:hypothetical protein
VDVEQTGPRAPTSARAGLRDLLLEMVLTTPIYCGYTWIFLIIYKIKELEPCAKSA